MKKVVIFGAGNIGQLLYSRVKDRQNVLFFVDNNYEKHSITYAEVMPPSVLTETNFDLIYIAAVAGLESIYKQLTEDLRVLPNKINRLYAEYWQNHNSTTFRFKDVEELRVKFLNSFAFYAYEHNIEGAVAEIGVFQGHFSCEINRVFPERKLYLFDTFGGFDGRDLNIESNINPESYSLFKNWVVEGVDYLKDGNVSLVLEKMPHPESCFIKKGYFPETFDIENESFVFINIDTDLYQPTKAGLEVFYPLMSKGGVILVHDYFCCVGVAKAVDEFIGKEGLTAIPIGDLMSIAIVKNDK